MVITLNMRHSILGTSLDPDVPIDPGTPNDQDPPLVKGHNVWDDDDDWD